MIDFIKPFIERYEIRYADHKHPCPVCGSASLQCFIVRDCVVECKTNNEIYNYKIELFPVLEDFREETMKQLKETKEDFEKNAKYERDGDANS